jgi:hypothetical protein
VGDRTEESGWAVLNRFHVVKPGEWSLPSLTMMMETQQVSETLVFNLTITQLITQVVRGEIHTKFQCCNFKKEDQGKEWSDYVILSWASSTAGFHSQMRQFAVL